MWHPVVKILCAITRTWLRYVRRKSHARIRTTLRNKFDSIILAVDSAVLAVIVCLSKVGVFQSIYPMVLFWTFCNIFHISVTGVLSIAEAKQIQHTCLALDTLHISQSRAIKDSIPAGRRTEGQSDAPAARTLETAQQAESAYWALSVAK